MGSTRNKHSVAGFAGIKADGNALQSCFPRQSQVGGGMMRWGCLLKPASLIRNDLD